MEFMGFFFLILCFTLVVDNGPLARRTCFLCLSVDSGTFADLRANFPQRCISNGWNAAF